MIIINDLELTRKMLENIFSYNKNTGVYTPAVIIYFETSLINILLFFHFLNSYKLLCQFTTLSITRKSSSNDLENDDCKDCKETIF